MSARGLQVGVGIVPRRLSEPKRIGGRGFRQASVLELVDSWSIEIDGRTHEKHHFRMRTRSHGFRRLGGDRVSPQLPQLLGKKSSDSRRAERSDFIERGREFWL